MFPMDWLRTPNQTFVVYEPSKLSAEPAEETMSLFVPLIWRYGVATPCRWSTSIKIFNRVKNASEYTGSKANIIWKYILNCFHHTILLRYVKYEMSIALGIQIYQWRDLSCSYFQKYEFSVELKSSKASGLKYVTILWQIFPVNEGICKGHLEMYHQYFNCKFV